VNVLRQVEGSLPALARAEKAELLRMVVQDLGGAFPGVESTPGVCGWEPCIARTGIPVWGWSKPSGWAPVRKSCCAVTRFSEPKISPTPGPACDPAVPRLKSRSAKTKRPERWPASNSGGSFLFKSHPAARVLEPFLVLPHNRALCTKWVEVTVAAQGNGNRFECADAESGKNTS